MEQEKSAHKNVLFLLADDQRFGTIRALGNHDVRTPNLDWLVQNGTSFTGAHLPGGTSGAICMPSRAMLLTGRTLFHIEGEGQSIPKQHTMLPEVLRRAGYTCFGTGKWHNGPPAFTRGFSCGEDIFFGGMWDHWNVPVCRHDPTGVYDNVINFVSDFPHTNKPRRIHCDAIHPGIHSSRVVTDSALRFLERHTDDAPFFAYVSYLAPHDPRTMPPQYRDLYDPAALTLPANWAGQHPFAFGVEDIRDETLLPTPRTQEALRNELADYYAMISHLDAEIGRLLSHLRETGQIDNTVVVFTSDNGLSLGSHGLLGKQNLYEESVRVPLVFAGGGVPQGQTVQGNVYLMDIFPTLCELLRLPIPASVEGESFCTAFANPAAPLRETLYFVYNDLLRAIKHGNHKLIHYAMPGQPTHKIQLFDTQADPLEQNDLSGTRPALAAELSKILRAQSEVWENTNHPYSDAFWGELLIHTLE